MDGDLRKHFRAKLPDMDWQSVETGGTGRGVPDLNFCWRGIEGWVEFKLAKGWQVSLRPEQVGWLMRRSRAGGRTFIITRQQTKALDTLHIHAGAAAGALKASGLRGGPPALFQAFGGPRSWDWKTIQRTLVSALRA